MRRLFLLILGLVAFFASHSCLLAQRLNPVYQAYVQQYADEAIRQMNRHRIPASITLAQGMVETGAGTSSLAKDHNNHFGIKCHRSWNGGKTYRTDDRPDECFRSYKNHRESFEDHSLFLKQARYQSLFNLKISDYTGWAVGLQRCGYATNKGYANLLIKMIEDYQLYAFDQGKVPTWYQGRTQYRADVPKKKRAAKQPTEARQAYLSYGLLYVLANEGEELRDIADEFDLNVKKLAKYNDVSVDFPLTKGMVVFLQRKNGKATDPHFTHVVKVGESMHSISQMYGMQMENLYRLNNKDGEYVPEEGDILRLR
ncbi:MAG: glucosaminidase domain-containing protein [Porphyromonas sp.]|nr:glucosaminidase domain-containing protein [Porphyromonas sp.]